MPPGQPAPGIALLVDGENIPRSCATAILGHLKPFGQPRIRRVYGGGPHIAGWEDHGFRLCPSRPGKNSADMLLCVEAMMLALREGVHTIAIASADRDFNYLAEQLREIGHNVIGIGKPTAPVSFRESCSAFYTLSDQTRPAIAAAKAAPSAAPPQVPASRPGPQAKAAAPRQPIHQLTKLIPMVRKILTKQSSGDGWGSAAWLHGRILSDNPGFHRHDYGSGGFETMLKQLNYFETRKEPGKKMQFRLPVPQANPDRTDVQN